MLKLTALFASTCLAFGVVLLIIMQDIFPIKEAHTDEHFRNLLCNDKTDLNPQKFNGQNMGVEQKDLMLPLFSYDSDKR